VGRPVVRVQLASIDLIGGGRRVEFDPGLNIITGPISTGKTTFVRLCRALLSASLSVSDFPREARNHVKSVAGQVLFGESNYSIVRPLVSTNTAKVDIAGVQQSWRLPADRPDPTSPLTYGQWLLRTLQLPELRVPSAPTRPDSESTPVTISDYFLYCRLTQDEIDTSVFAHTDPFRNIKRKYVFEILYGLYNPRMAGLQEELRTIQARIRQLDTRTEAFQEFLQGTPWSNRASLVRDLSDSERELASLETRTITLADSIHLSSPLQNAQMHLRNIDASREQKAEDLRRAMEGLDQLDRLLRQLDAQIGRLTRSIVADSFLRDLEFIVCPRCATAVDVTRGDEERCGLCLQIPQGHQFDRSTLIAEQDRLGSQVQETRELIDARQLGITQLQQELTYLDKEREQIGSEVDFLSRSFVSDRAADIAAAAAERARLTALVSQLRDYLGLFAGLDRALGDLSALNERRAELESELSAASESTGEAERNRSAGVRIHCAD
jgi:hypothetical protein